MCELDLPTGAVVLNQLHIVEYMDPEDGEIYKIDFSVGGDGHILGMGKALELLEWGRALTISPLIAEMVLEYVTEDEDDE